MKSYRIHHMHEFGWAIDVFEDGWAKARRTGFNTAAEAAVELALMVEAEGNT